MFKFSKKSWIIIFILVVLYVVISNIYELFNSMEADNNKARENLSALIKWSENEGKEELKYAKNLSKETYNQEKATQMIIKNLKMIQTNIEDMKTLSSHYPAEEDVELMRQAGHVTTNSNTDIILYLLYNERNITNHKTYFLFDKERFKIFEDFLFFLNTHLEEDFLQKDINKFGSFDMVKIGIYINALIGYNRAFTDMYLGEFSQNYICDLNTPKTITILNGMNKIDFTSDRILLFFNKELEKYAYTDDDNLIKNFQKMIYIFKKAKLNQQQTNKLKSIQSKLKECKK